MREVEFAFNNTVNRSARTTPSMLLFGVDQRGPVVDYLTEYLEEKPLNPIERNLPLFRRNAAEAIQPSQNYNLQKFSEIHKPAVTYEIGQYVVIPNVDTSAGSNRKLIQKYRGPYRVQKVLPNDRYVIRDVEGCQLTQMPYDGDVEARHLKLWKSQEKENSVAEEIPNGRTQPSEIVT